jgi:anthranilate synthase/aminodeoxychorismate synthase-like glutamine amidotransferase
VSPSPLILVIDNQDSFTWNLVDLLRQGTMEVAVLRNDLADVAQVLALQPAGIVISPGPGRPEDSKLSLETCKLLLGKVPILGVCLGHQLLGMLCGLEVKNALAPVHGKTSWVHHTGGNVYAGMPNPFPAMRYHSLVLATPDRMPEGLEVNAWTADAEIMGIHHNFLNFDAVQFHPESILTEGGGTIIKNWMYSLEG